MSASNATSSVLATSTENETRLSGGRVRSTMFEFECFFNYLLTTFGKISVLAFFIWTIKEILMGICTCKGNLRNKIVVITGATSGIGSETALGKYCPEN